MKLVMENWRKFVKETDNDSVPTQLPPEDKKKVEDVIKQLIALQQGVEAAADASQEEEIDEGNPKLRQARRKNRIKRQKEIKRMAGLSGIHLRDFTPEQKQIYAQAKADYEAKYIQGKMDLISNTVAHNLTYGDLLKNPIAKKILDKLPEAVKTTLLAQAGENCLQSGAITLTCLMQGFAQNFGMMEERDQDAF